TSALKLQLEGRKYGEIALRLSKSETEVTNYIHRAKKRLRAQIESLIREYSGDDLVRAEIADLVKYL
ncbi:MAG TPA: sigma factor-like helix-turn-helix DNA-binding protein, partial [Planctomycetota bacterium]|nr:sigma factor-like helix-turn-helix DNA-binding protein [Planctomycetota bacterium]